VFGWLLSSLPQFALLLAVCAALYLAPGYALLQWLWPASARPLHPAERFALALGIGIALPPVLLYIAHLIGMIWSAGATWLYVVVACVALIAPFVLRFAKQKQSSRPTPDPSPLGRGNKTPLPKGEGSGVGSILRVLPAKGPWIRWEFALLLGMTLFALAVQLYLVNGLRAGMFGDSVHHTLMVRLLLERGGLFSSWQPYAPLTTFTYHFGFHSNVAFYAWLTGVPATLSTLIIGQVLNAATVPLIFVFTARALHGVGKGKWPLALVAGLWAAAFAGFANLMPAFYVNWGRYTQLAGQLILMALAVAWFELIEASRMSAPTLPHPQPLPPSTSSGQAREWSKMLALIALAALLTASLMLTHYIVLMFAVVIVGAYFLTAILREGNWRGAAKMLVPAAIASLIALVFALPWIMNTLTSGLVRNTAVMASGAAGANRQAAASALTSITPLFIRPWLLALTMLGLLIGLARRHWHAALFTVWALLMIVLVTPQTLGLPGAGVVEQFTAYIALYVPLMPLAGYALASMQDWLIDNTAARLPRIDLHKVMAGITTIAIAAICAFGLTWLPGIVNRGQQMLTAADEQAMQWIRDNVPADARFVVNTFPAYGGTLIAGTDAGWWLTQLTGRWTNLPPITYGSEKWEREDFYATTNNFVAALRGQLLTDAAPITVNLTTAENVQRLRDAGITHVYIGANATPGVNEADHIDVDALRNSDAFRVIYDQAGVLIFERVK
jgi:hypothetical protein